MVVGGRLAAFLAPVETIARSRFGPSEPSPTNGPLPPRLQCFVGAAERFAVPKSAVCRQEDSDAATQSACPVGLDSMLLEQTLHEGFGLDRPQDPNQRLLRLHQIQQCRLNQHLPPQMLMRACVPNSVVSDVFNIRTPCSAQSDKSVGRSAANCKSLERSLNMFRNGRRRRQGGIGHTEGQTMSLSRSVVRILSQKHDPHLGRSRQLKRPPHVSQRRTQDVGALPPA